MKTGFSDGIKSLGKRTGPIGGGLANTLILIGSLTILYFLFGRLAFSMAVSEGSATSMAFLPEGLALASVILFGPRVSAGIFLGQWLLSLSLGVPFPVGAAFGLINMIEGVVGGRLFWRWKISPSLGTPRDVVMLFVLSALVLQPAAALAKAFPRLAISDYGEIVHLSIYSWAGNTMGQFLVVPLVLAWCCSGCRFENKELKRSLFILGLYFAGILLFEYFQLGEIDKLYWLSIYGAFYLVLIWNAIQSGPLVTSLINFLTTMGFLCSIVASRDALLYFSTQDRVLYADFLILGGVATALIISSLVRQLVEKTSQLTLANRAMERMLAMIGHDLRSPFVDISTALDVLRHGKLETGDFQSTLKHLRQTTDQARCAFENVMEWAALQIDDLKPSPALWNVRTIIWDVFELFRMKAEIKGIQVEIETPDDAKVYADRQHLSSILRNLFSNALTFTEEGGKVAISANRMGDFWKLSVKDTGIGIPRREVERILGNEREMKSKPYKMGAGIGLWIVSNLVKTNQGTFEVESAEGKGSTFSFTLPAADFDR
ncbi:MAG: ATP-binding protein [Luteolibacter sp.]